MREFLLNAVERDSKAWGKVKGCIEQRIDTLRDELEIKGRSEAETEYTRGRISELRALLDLEKERVDFKSASVVR